MIRPRPFSDNVNNPVDGVGASIRLIVFAIVCGLFFWMRWRFSYGAKP
jgi:hypothetical protein